MGRRHGGIVWERMGIVVLVVVVVVDDDDDDSYQNSYFHEHSATWPPTP